MLGDLKEDHDPLNILSAKKSISWLRRSNVLFIVCCPKIDELELLRQLDRLYKCSVMEVAWSVQQVVKYVEKKGHVTKFLINGSAEGLLEIIHNIADRSFKPIIVSKCPPVVSSFPRQLYPVFVGWLWTNRDRNVLRNVARMCLTRLLDIPRVKEELSSRIRANSECDTSPVDEQKDNAEPTALFDHWTLQKSPLHVSSYFIGDHRSTESDRYLNDASRHFYSTDKATLSGMLLTARTFSGHMDLSPSMESLFQLPYDDPNHQHDPPIPGHELFKYLPHVTLALAKGASAVQSGWDQVPVQRLIAQEGLPTHSWDIPIGSVYDLGDQFYVTLKKPLAYSLMFCPCFG